jgi:hypothetical protein
MRVKRTYLLAQLESWLFIRFRRSNIWSIRGSHDACVALPLPVTVDFPPMAFSAQFGANISWWRFSVTFRHGFKFSGNESEGANKVPHLWFCSGHPWARKGIQRLMITLWDIVFSEWWSPARIILWTVSKLLSVPCLSSELCPCATFRVHANTFKWLAVWMNGLVDWGV